MTESIKMIEFGPEGPRVVEVFAPPVLATRDVRDEVTWQEIAIAWAAVLVVSFVAVKWLLWPVARWVIALVGW